MQSRETMRNSLSLNYKSAALPAELCRHRPHTKAVYSEVDQEFPMAQLARRSAPPTGVIPGSDLKRVINVKKNQNFTVFSTA